MQTATTPPYRIKVQMKQGILHFCFLQQQQQQQLQQLQKQQTIQPIIPKTDMAKAITIGSTLFK